MHNTPFAKDAPQVLYYRLVRPFHTQITPSQQSIVSLHYEQEKLYSSLLV